MAVKIEMLPTTLQAPPEACISHTYTKTQHNNKERERFRYKESDLFEHVGPINRAIRTVDMVNPPKY